MVERETQRRLPREIQAAATFGLSVRNPIKELGQAQGGHHRGRMGRPSPVRAVERIEDLIGKNRPPDASQDGQEPLVDEEVGTQHVAVREQSLSFGGSSHVTSRGELRSCDSCRLEIGSRAPSQPYQGRIADHPPRPPTVPACPAGRRLPHH
jgi:hypothetical protein